MVKYAVGSDVWQIKKIKKEQGNAQISTAMPPEDWVPIYFRELIV